MEKSILGSVNNVRAAGYITITCRLSQQYWLSRGYGRAGSVDSLSQKATVRKLEVMAGRPLKTTGAQPSQLHFQQGSMVGCQLRQQRAASLFRWQRRGGAHGLESLRQVGADIVEVLDTHR
jgi:hypothetical protein